MSFISNVKNCENNVIQSTCNGAPSAGQVEGYQTATVGELGTDLASQAYPIMSEVNTRKLSTTKRQLSIRFNTRIFAFSTYLKLPRAVKMTVCLITKKYILVRHYFVS